jgi:hypothetical protein
LLGQPNLRERLGRSLQVIGLLEQRQGLRILVLLPEFNPLTDQVFGIQFSSEHRGSHQIYEDHGELAALCRGGGLDARLDLRRCNYGFGRCRSKLRRSGKEFAAVTERKPQFLQVLLGQLWDDGKVDIMAC